jgi:hypothetical protein
MNKENGLLINGLSVGHWICQSLYIIQPILSQIVQFRIKRENFHNWKFPA